MCEKTSRTPAETPAETSAETPAAETPAVETPTAETPAESAQEQPPVQPTSAIPGGTVVPDEDDAIPSEADSAFGDEISSYSASLRSSVLNYRYENGRRYHGYRDGSYMAPNDEAEQSRLDLMHHIFRVMLDGALHVAPISKDIQRILDVGTGTGILFGAAGILKSRAEFISINHNKQDEHLSPSNFASLGAIDMADEFPSAIVIGTDLSPIQPTWVPPNCKFYVDDAETQWEFEQKFDFIHGRALCGGIADWPKFYREAFENLEPGGWLEMQEHECWVKSDDGTDKDAVWTNEWNEELDRASLIFGKRWHVAEEQIKWIRDAGFEEVKEIIHKVPIGPWAKDPKLKELGRYQFVNMTEAVNSFTPATFTRVLGYSTERMQVLMAGVKGEFANYRKLHLYVAYHFIWGRKPMNAS